MDDTNLKEQLGAAQLREAALKDAVDERDETIAELESRLSATAKAENTEGGKKDLEIPTKTAYVEGEGVEAGNYEIVVAAFNVGDKRYIAAEVIENAEQMYGLVRNGVGYIRKVD